MCELLCAGSTQHILIHGHRGGRDVHAGIAGEMEMYIFRMCAVRVCMRACAAELHVLCVRALDGWQARS